MNATKTVKHSAPITTKASAKPAAEKPYSLVGVDNMLSVKGSVLQMNVEEAAKILAHVKTKYPHLTLAKDVVLRLPQERKNAVLLRCTDGTPRLTRTSDCFQYRAPLLSEKAREEAKVAKKVKVPAKVSIKTTLDGKKATPKMLQKAMDEVKARAAKGASTVRVKVTKGSRTRKALKAAPATPVTPVTPSVPATVAATSSPTTQA